MATAYAAFTSLMHLIKDLHEHSHPPIKLEEEQLDSLNSNISFFRRFLEDHHTSIDLGSEIRIADAAYAAEDVIETHIADRVLDQVDFNESLQKAIEGIELIKKDVMNINWTEKSQGSNQPLAKSSQPPSANSGENIVVGIEDMAIRIVDKLTQPHMYGRQIQIVSITGMGGIGKTTLARMVYDHKYIKDYFHFRGWATISKNYDTRESLLELLRCMRGIDKGRWSNMSEHELGERLYKSLIGRPYLVIVDDVWDIEAWDRLRSFFPSGSGSAIVITTRESRVASISSHTFRMNFLNERETWGLFCKTVFGQDNCPRELEDVGKEISDNCRGLPLSVVVIGGHLAKSPRTQEYWRSIAKNLSSIVNSEDDDRCLKILSLSYVHLPVHLKPCFLYMGILPEDEEIDVRKLIRLWVAEGFLKPINGKSLEEAAKDYLNDLIGRNLILVSGLSRRGEVIRCKFHDLLRDLSLKEALEKKFFCIVRKQVLELSNNERRIIIYPNMNKVDHCYSDTIVLKSPSVLRTLIFHDKLLLVFYKSLRVLASATQGCLDVSLINNMEEITRQLVNLRFLDFSSSKWNEFVILPSSIFSIWNLQYLDIVGVKGAEAPEEIWKMSQLRQISINYSFSLSDPQSESDDILKNLQSAETILNFSFGEDLVKRIPYVNRLSVKYDDSGADFSEGAYALNNITRLEKLESFHCRLHEVRSITRRNDMLSNLAFPHSLKILSVSGLHWDDVTTKIGSLPLLEELSLSRCRGSEWKLVEGQFVRLKFLVVRSCQDLEHFTADTNHFPCLEVLELHLMYGLKEISSDIGDIQTLGSIKLYHCRDPAVLSAKEIADYQKNQMGNEELHVTVRLLKGSRLSNHRDSTSNFHVQR